MSHERTPFLRRPTELLFDYVGKARKRTTFGAKILSKGIARPPIVLATRIFVSLAERKIVKPIKPEYAEGFGSAFIKAMQDPNTLPILICNHEGHADIASIAIVSQNLTNIINGTRDGEDQFRGFMLTIAASLETGHQNLFLQETTRQAKKRFLNYHLVTQAFVRETDREKYGLVSNNLDYMRKLMEIIKGEVNRGADGLAFFPQGSVESGRRMENGENKGRIKGMQKFNCSELYELIQGIELKYKRKVLIIPIGSHGAGKVISPDHRRPTLAAIEQMSKLHPKPLMVVKVGLPREWDSLVMEIGKQEGRQATAEDVGNSLGKIVASLLPPDARGEYR